jgi:tripartite-type tricarboxylate transporter receptor subunit TctC
VILCLGLFAGACVAQDYPSKPIRIIVGFPPGGATDLVARILQPRLSQGLQREIVITTAPARTARWPRS